MTQTLILCGGKGTRAYPQSLEMPKPLMAVGGSPILLHLMQIFARQGFSDFVLAGGELAALVVVEAVARLLPGVLGNEESARDESFTEGLLEYPQYTRPAEFRGWPVPEVLRSGDHGAVAAWRRSQALLRTAERRPDLIARLVRASALSVSDVQALSAHGYDVLSGTEPV